MIWSEILMMNKLVGSFAGFTGLLGGLYFLFNTISLNWLLEGLNTLHNPAAALLIKSSFWCVMSLCLVSGGLALLSLYWPETAWQHKLGVASTVVTLLGVAAYLVGSIYVLILLIEYYAYFLHQSLI
jgi:hypothetical protein